MYNEKILNQLDNLKYLGASKCSNITIVSKPNEYNDAVKFYAQINKDDIIQKISYRASGCTHFLVFCNYFCSLVDGKNIKSALNVNSEKLNRFVELDESKEHIISIILDTFALLIKKYRKGVEKGKIEPCESEIQDSDAPKTRPMTSKTFTKVVDEIMKNIELSNKSQISVSKDNESVDKSKIETENNKTEEKIVKEKIDDISTKVAEKEKTNNKNKSTNKKEILTPVEDEKTIEELNKEITVLIDKIEDDIVDSENVEKATVANEPIITDKKENKFKTKTTKSTTGTTKLTNQKEEVKKEVDNNLSKQSNNLLALKAMINKSNTTSDNSNGKKDFSKKSEIKLNNLTSMVNKINSNKISNETKNVEKKNTSKQTTKAVSTKNDVAKKDIETSKEDKLSALKLSLANFKTTANSTAKKEDTLKKDKK